MAKEEKVAKTLSLRKDLLEELENLIFQKYKIYLKGMLSLEVNHALEVYIELEKKRLGLA